MGHKTHPLGFRLGSTQEHKSSWYSKLNLYSSLIQEDYAIRHLILNFLGKDSVESTGITTILINRINQGKQINIEVQTTKPGVLVGESGRNLDKIDKNLTKLLPTKKTLINIIEITDGDQHASLLADRLVVQLENRVPFRRALKGILDRIQEKKIKGIKIQIAGRVNGAEIARTEWLREGRVPLQTLRADIDYSYKIAQTIHGSLGIKVWLFKGEILTK